MQPTQYNPSNLNIYVCDRCGEHVVTKDTEDGVTPFMIGCKAGCGCRGMMTSSMYRVFDPDGKMKWTYEWYRPSADRVISLSQWEYDHVSKGGLLLRLAATHRHVKTRGQYRLTAIGHFNYSHPDDGYSELNRLDRAPVTIYRNNTGEWNVRLTDEFNDGRFEEINNV